MANSGSNARALALTLFNDRYDSYSRTHSAELQFSVVRCSSYGTEIRGVSDWDQDVFAGISDGALYGFRVTSWLEAGISTYYGDADPVTDEYRVKRRQWGESYGYHDLSRIDLRQAEAMAKVLKLVGKRLEKFREEEGQYESFGQYVARVARAIGASILLVQKNFERMTSRSSAWADNGYVAHRLGDGAFAINCRVDDWLNARYPLDQYNTDLTNVRLARAEMLAREELERQAQAALPAPAYETLN